MNNNFNYSKILNSQKTLQNTLTEFLHLPAAPSLSSFGKNTPKFQKGEKNIANHSKVIFLWKGKQIQVTD